MCCEAIAIVDELFSSMSAKVDFGVSDSAKVDLWWGSIYTIMIYYKKYNMVII